MRAFYCNSLLQETVGCMQCARQRKRHHYRLEHLNEHHIKCGNVWSNNTVRYRNILWNVAAVCLCP